MFRRRRTVADDARGAGERRKRDVAAVDVERRGVVKHKRGRLSRGRRNGADGQRAVVDVTAP